MNRQRQREREIQRQRERQQNNDMMTEGVVLMSLWPRAINLLISNWSQTQKFSQSFKNTSREDGSFSLFSSLNFIRLLRVVVTPSVTWEKKTTRSNRMNFRLTFLTIVTRWSRSTIVQCLCSDWSKFDRWVHAETDLYSILNLVYFQFDSWSWQSILSTCDVFYCLFPLNA